MARREWSWVAIVAALTLLGSSVPILAGYAAQTDEWRFAGAVYDVQDYFSHLAKIQLGARGEFRYRSLFTAEPHSAEPVILNDIALGLIASRLGLTLPATYELSRLGGGLALVLSAYLFISQALPEPPVRRLALVLAIVSSGLGWLVVNHPRFSYPNQSPIDFWLADGYLLFSIMAFPHFGWSIAALLAGLTAWQRFAAEPRWRWLALLVGTSALLGFLQVFELVLLDSVIALDAVRRALRDRRTLRPSLAAGLALAPLHAAMVWPYVHALRTNPLFQVWTVQSRTLSPPPLYYLLGYGLLWPLVAMGLAWAWRRRDGRLALPALWIGAVAVLVYSPNGVQFRWLEGVQVPLAILAAVGLAKVLVPAVAHRLRDRADLARLSWWITALAVVATMPSTLYLVAGNALLAATRWEPAFFRRDELAGMDWLAAHSDPDDIVLAGLRVGNAIPGRTGHRVYYGHWAETMYYAEKGALVESFFSTMADEDRRSLLRTNGVRYVFHGPDEQELGTFDPGEAAYLSLRFSAGETAVYEVTYP